MDEAILRALNASMRVPVLAWIAVFLSSPWMLIGTTAPLAVVLIRKKAIWAILSIALAMGAADAINARIVKPMVARERPCRALTNLELPDRCNVGQSFASGHASVAFAFAITAAPTIRYGWFIFPVLAFLVALSRVLLGVHYPTDITAGAVFGASVGTVFLLARRAIEKARAPSPPHHDPPATNAPAGPSP
jgi:membrane-associated phospholipid phosphatase